MRPRNNTPGGCSQMLLGSHGREGGKAQQPPPCPQQGERADKSCWAPVVWTPHVTFPEATPGLAGSVTSRAGLWDAWDRPIPHQISSGHKLGEKSFFSSFHMLPNPSSCEAAGLGLFWLVHHTLEYP